MTKETTAHHNTNSSSNSDHNSNSNRNHDNVIVIIARVIRIVTRILLASSLNPKVCGEASSAELPFVSPCAKM